MLNLNYTPLPLRYTYIVGQSWHFYFQLTDLTIPIDLAEYDITGVVYFLQEQKTLLNNEQGIIISNDGKGFELIYDFLSISTDTAGNSIIVPSIASLPTGTYTIRIFFTNKVLEDIVPIFLYVDVVAAPSDSCVIRAYKNQVVSILLNNRIVIGIETGGTSSGNTGSAVLPASQMNAGIARFANVAEATIGEQLNTMLSPATLAAYMAAHGNLRRYIRNVSILANVPLVISHNLNLMSSADCIVDCKKDGKKVDIEISYDTINSITLYTSIDIKNLNIIIIA